MVLKASMKEAQDQKYFYVGKRLKLLKLEESTDESSYFEVRG